MSTPRVLFYVQHLLGIGHLRRGVLLARALAAAGTEVTLLAGGPPLADLELGGARLVALPALRAGDAGFRTLEDAAGRPAGEDLREARRARLLGELERLQPHLLMIETFPFGRRQMRFELLPLLEAAAARRPRPCIVCSVRDIVQERRDPARLAWTVDTVRRFFDHVLVHGDPALVRFEQSFAAAGALGPRLHYTGIVAEDAERYAAPGGAAREVLVSAGGGAVGGGLLRAALRARRHSRLAGLPWRLLAGPNLPAAELAALRTQAPPGVIVEPARGDFPRLLAGCAVSISQAGYNTVADLLRARARSVLVPFRGAGETEQTLRAARLAALGLARVIAESELEPLRLARAVDAAARRLPPAASLDLEGARTSARRVAEWAARRAARD